MAEQRAVVKGLIRRWARLRQAARFLPPLARMNIRTAQYPLEAIEFVRVEPVDRPMIVPAAPHVTTTSVTDYPGWSEAAADQLAMWALLGTRLQGDRTTHTCPDCEGSKRVTCDRCHGRGRVNCSSCHGSGYGSCSSCGGSGGRSVTTTSTDADGNSSSQTNWESCNSCGGSGRQSCTWCWGSGTQRCSTCSGTGDLVCETCSPEGTVDRFIERSFVARSLATELLPVSLPGYPRPITLSHGHVTLYPRNTVQPLDRTLNRAELNQRQILEPRSQLFFIREATVELHSLFGEGSDRLCATWIEGEPEPLFTWHESLVDPQWSPEQERQRAFIASLLYALSLLSLVGFGLNGLGLGRMGGSGIGPEHAGGAGTSTALSINAPLLLAGVAAAVLLGLCGFWLGRGPLRAFRVALTDPRCAQHGSPAPMRCPACAKDLCQECLASSLRCPHCEQVVSEVVTHLVEGGEWVSAAGEGRRRQGERLEG